MVYNYFVNADDKFCIKTPGNHSFDDILKNIKSDGEITINHSTYPDGFEITMTQMAHKVNITTNMELVKHDDGYYYIKEN